MATDPGATPRVLILGASGLIGQFLAVDLARRRFGIVALARSFTAAQRFSLGEGALVEAPVVDLGTVGLARLLDRHGADVVVNAVGVLQDGPGARTQEVHEAFVLRLLAAIGSLERPILLVHIGVPGRPEDDPTQFSLTKRRAERHIRAAGLPYAILRPGFVVAPAAYGGSALLRALAVLPVDLPAAELARPFASVAIEDIADTIAFLLRTWTPSDRGFAASFDLMHPEPSTVGDAIDHLRRWLGKADRRRLVLPGILLQLGARAGDLAGRLGWVPPIRSTALAELRRGVVADPGPWIAATGIAPRPIEQVLMQRPADIQEKWFARLYLLKPLVIGVLTMFWCGSGLIALIPAYDAAVEILTARGFTAGPAKAITVASSVVDITVGLAIALRRSCRAGLLAGIAVSACYMAGAALLTPDLWLEPLGALLKTGPAIVLMLVALAILDRR